LNTKVANTIDFIKLTLYARNCTGKNQNAAYYLVDTSITGTSSDGYRNIIGLPRCGGPASPWRACLPVEQRKLG